MRFDLLRDDGGGLACGALAPSPFGQLQNVFAFRLPLGSPIAHESLGTSDAAAVLRYLAPGMSRLLICTVGGAPQPLVRSLQEEPRPDRVVFVCSLQSERSITAPAGPVQPRDGLCACGRVRHECVDPTGVLALAAVAGIALADGAYSIVTVSDPQDFTACLRDMEDKLGPIVDSWLRPGTDRRVVVDPTGGTKCMSAALGIVARQWPCVLRYIGGGSRTRAGLGVVENASEKVFYCENPLDALGYQAAEDAILLCSRNNFGAAAQLLQAAMQKVSDPQSREGLRALETLTSFFSLWDRFAHRKARRSLHPVRRHLPALARHLSAESVEEIEAAVSDWDARLKTLSSAEVSTRELVEDLLSNANRRREEQRFDDAVGRLYRAIEAIAQFRLASRHNVMRTANVPASQVPEPLRSELEGARPAGQEFKLGLQDSFRLLAALNDDVGRLFCSSSLASRGSSLLSARNTSILAHGFSTVAPAVCDQLWEGALHLAALIGIDGNRLFRFPRLRRHAG